MQNYFQILKQLYIMKNYFDLQGRNTNNQILQLSSLLILELEKFFGRCLVAERVFLIAHASCFLAAPFVSAHLPSRCLPFSLVNFHVFLENRALHYIYHRHCKLVIDGAMPS